MEKRAKGMPKFERSAGKEQRYRLDEGPYVNIYISHKECLLLWKPVQKQIPMSSLRLRDFVF